MNLPDSTISQACFSLLQAAAPEGAPAPSGPRPTPNAFDGFMQGPWLMILGMFAFMYVLMIRPQQKERKRQEALRKGLKKGDRVVTQSGIVANVRQVQDGAEIVLDLDGSAKITVLKTSIVQVLNAPSAETALAKK